MVSCKGDAVDAFKGVPQSFQEIFAVDGNLVLPAERALLVEDASKRDDAFSERLDLGLSRLFVNEASLFPLRRRRVSGSNGTAGLKETHRSHL